MKIQKSKSSVKASEDIVPVVEQIPVPVEPDNKQTAIEFIQSAVSSLSAFALEHPDDTVVTDSIANLGVVLLDLKAGI